MEEGNAQQKAWSYLQLSWPKPEEACTTNVLRKYDSWDNYDEDMVTLGYQVPTKVREAIMKLNIPVDATILDVGCGTGLLGKLLQDEGYLNVDGHDGSETLLHKAVERKVYRHTFCCIIDDDRKFPVDDGYYDVVVTAGGISPGHFSLDAIKDMVPMIKPGGYLGYSGRRQHLEKKDHIELQSYFDQLVLNGEMEQVLEEIYDSIYSAMTNATDISLEGITQFYRKVQI